MNPIQETENLARVLGIEFLEATPERVVATMQVLPRVHQPFGLLHGGASVVLAETVASTGAYLGVREQGMVAVGLEINANHIRPKRDGVVTATGLPLHRGKSTQVWDIKITDEAGKLICVSRCTVAIVKGT